MYVPDGDAAFSGMNSEMSFDSVDLIKRSVICKNYKCKVKCIILHFIVLIVVLQRPV